MTLLPVSLQPFLAEILGILEAVQATVFLADGGSLVVMQPCTNLVCFPPLFHSLQIDLGSTVDTDAQVRLSCITCTGLGLEMGQDMLQLQSVRAIWS